jgi:hypothetical protein
MSEIVLAVVNDPFRLSKQGCLVITQTLIVFQNKYAIFSWYPTFGRGKFLTWRSETLIPFVFR